MPNSPSLSPHDRSLYTENLRPPPGYLFDSAIATTYTLDLETLLTIPVSLSLFAVEDAQDESNPLALLEGIERTAERIVVFTEAGNIKAKENAFPRLCSLMETMVVEVLAPAGGAFHPKVWLLRFKPTETGPIRFRLLVLSRNLTRDRAWDISLCLDGTDTGELQAGNEAIIEFVESLSKLSVRDAPDHAAELVEQVTERLPYIHWELPPPFTEVAFRVNGLGNHPLKLTPCSRLGIVSPFCDNRALGRLRRLTQDYEPKIVSRQDQLDEAFGRDVSGDLLDGYKALILDDRVETADGEDTEGEQIQGLHAKIFIAERGSETNLTVGSGNATAAALLDGRNVEFFASLAGPKAEVGDVETILGPEGFGQLTQPYCFGEIEDEVSPQDMERHLKQAQRDICLSGLKLHCVSEGSDSDEQWRVHLCAEKPLSLAQVSSLQVWLITQGKACARNVLKELRSGASVDLGRMSLLDVTGFTAFSMVASDNETSHLFSTCLEVEGLPEGRYTQIFRNIINNDKMFFRYLRLLLAHSDDPFAATDNRKNWKGGSENQVGEQASIVFEPVLEELVRDYCNGATRLKSVDRLIERLSSDGKEEASVVPDDFLKMWAAFREAMVSEGGGQ
ncbi:MAG: phospholipase D family protein [Pseudomonadota bacterium]